MSDRVEVKETPLFTYRGHISGAHALSLSPDGQFFASSHSDKNICVWEVKTEKCILRCRKKRSGYYHENPVSWSPDGRFIAAGYYEVFTLWDAQTGKEIYSIHLNDVDWLIDLTWSPDSKKIAVSSYLKTVLILDGPTGECLFTYIGHQASVDAVAWSPDGKYIASGGGDQTVQVWDALAGKSIFTYSGHSAMVNTLAWSPDGKYIASGSNDATVQVWEVKRSQTFLFPWQKKSSSRHVQEKATGVVYRMLHPVKMVAWSPDGKYITSASKDLIEIWDAQTTTKLRSYQDIASTRSTVNEIQSFLWSPDGTWLLIASKNTIQRWSSSTDDLLTTYRNGHLAQILNIAWSSDGKEIASSGTDNTVQIWSALTGKLLNTLQLPMYPSGIAWSPDGQSIALYATEVQIWNVQRAEQLCVYQKHKDTVLTVAWSPDGKYIASGGSETTVQIWDTCTGTHLRTYAGHKKNVNTLNWSPDGRYVASGSDDMTVQIWEAVTGKYVHSYQEKGSPSCVKSIAWSPDGKYIAFGGYSHSIQVWGTVDKKQFFPRKGEFLFSDSRQVAALVIWSSDSSSLAACSSDGELSVWDFLTGKRLETRRFYAASYELPDEIMTLVWPLDKICIATADFGVHIWQAEGEGGEASLL